MSAEHTRRTDGRQEGREDARWGLTNPMGFLPTASRASLTSVRMEPTTGADADVPNTRANLPFTWWRGECQYSTSYAAQKTHSDDVVCANHHTPYTHASSATDERTPSEGNKRLTRSRRYRGTRGSARERKKDENASSVRTSARGSDQRHTYAARRVPDVRRISRLVFSSGSSPPPSSGMRGWRSSC